MSHSNNNNSPEDSDESDLPDAPSSPNPHPRKEADLKDVELKTKVEEDSEEDDYDEDPELLQAGLIALDQARYSDPEVLKAFYQRLFPFRYLFQWLNHSPIPTHDFGHREFAFTLRNDAYLRYQAFPTFETLRKQVLDLNPSRFEIGPIYNVNPRERKALSKSAFRPLAKELVFDIDLTDYDSIRTCCDKANICLKCWQFITVAIKVIDFALKDDLGFKHVLWVYSGRRGAHAWVCDKRARVMSDAKRKAVVGYLEVVKGGREAGKKVNLKRPLHPHLARSLNILKDSFEKNILKDQNPWQTDEQAEKLLARLPAKTLNDALRKKWASHANRPSTAKWADIDSVAATGIAKDVNPQKLKEAKQDIVLEYMYPRLDGEVSKHLNHLLKSPFCVHPGTGRVCVPVDVGRVEEFDPMAVPTVTGLLAEVDLWEQKENAEEKIADYEKTSLKGYVEYFRGFVNGLMKDEMKAKREREEAKGNPMEF
ncbi:p48 polypeptide of DNA primase [Rhizina undulata]